MSQIIIASTVRIAVLAGMFLKTKNLINQLNVKNIDKYNSLDFIAEVCFMGVVVIVAWGV